MYISTAGSRQPTCWLPAPVASLGRRTAAAQQQQELLEQNGSLVAAGQADRGLLEHPGPGGAASDDVRVRGRRLRGECHGRASARASFQSSQPSRSLTPRARAQAVCYDAKPKEGGGWDTSDWFDKKPALKEKNALMNLPYVIDGEHTIAQTNACFAHLGRVLGLYGSNYAETLKVEQCLCQVMDLRNDAVGAFYG